MQALTNEDRVIVHARMSPIVGSVFQPTGFPDLGAAEFERPSANGTTEPALLVESVQSLANHLEATAWDASGDRPVETVSRLPYVEVRNPEDRFLTSSRLEPHRLAGAYIKNADVDGEKVGDWMIERLGVVKGVPLDWRGIYRGIFEMDPLCLIHGVFFSDTRWKDYGNPKIRRAVTAVMEARDARPVVSGGVKRDDVNPTVGEGRSAKEGYGFIPFGRTEYTAAEITLGVSVDLQQIRGYDLGDAETELLIALALWEVASLLEAPLRLRTACDLVVDSIDVGRPSGWNLPTADALAEIITSSKVKFESGGARSATFE